jgi:hypothetical protein
LIPIGWRAYCKRTGKSTVELLNERFEPGDTAAKLTGSPVFRTIVILTAINVLFMGAASIQMLKFMDQPNFCGTACHSVMNPEWTTYQDSPHARVKCVECHVGVGVGAAVNAKLNGVWQMISVTFNLYEKPIPTPVRQLRPARETCEKCHWPDKFYGSRLKTIVHFAHDSNSTPRYTTLNLKIDADRGAEKAGIHWHIGRENQVRYTSINDEREDMIWVDVRRSDGSLERYINRELTAGNIQSHEIRVLDCVDCHNRATHIYEDPEDAIDRHILMGILPRAVPYVSREALHAITRNYPDTASAMAGISDHLNSIPLRYGSKPTGEIKTTIDSAVTVLQQIYRRNIHPGMNITWGSYPDHIGHTNTRGCFRCHDSRLVDDEGKAIPYDCTLCHSILASNDNEPFEYLNPPDSTDASFLMHEYLRDEFLKSFRESD